MTPRYATLSLDGDFTVHTVPGRIERGDDLDRAAGEHADAVEGSVFIAAMRLLASGVVIVTTRVDGRPWGMTISSCCSLTLEPPQLLVSLRSDSVSCRCILADGSFGVSILTSAHKGLAELGAATGSAKFIEDFCPADRSASIRSPIVSDALFHLDCVLADVHEVGDHRVMVGLVTQGLAAEGELLHDPLLYFDRSFWRLGERIG